MLVNVNQSKQAPYSLLLICVTLYKMADEREDFEATFQFIEEVQNCPDLWDVSSAAYKDTKNKQKKIRTSGETGVKMR